MKVTFIVFILGVLFTICYGAEEVGPTRCAIEIPPVETDAFNPETEWISGDKNFTVWEHRFNYFTTSSDYTIYDILVYAEPYDNATQLSQIWELEPVKGHSGYYRFPAWRREWGISAGKTHKFGYITFASSPMPLMLTFDIIKYTCSEGYEIQF